MEDTIAAVATAMGEGGIGIIRLSGEESLRILSSIFIGNTINNRVLTYGHIKDNFTGELIDEVMCVYMKAPHSYTAEDVVEIQCHGSIVSLRKILALVLKNGARLAEPGEYTKRAFLNGRLDLSQAEAVIDLIKAKSDKTFDVALDQLEGKYSQYIRQIRAKLVDILVNVTVNIDYPDEDIEELTYANLDKSLEEVIEMLHTLLSTADAGRIIKEGLKVAIIGKPNVGKSSLMNAILQENRAIVTEIPGTTRDTIEESVSVRNIPLILTDTAGIRETDDVIEKIGIEKSKESFNKADLIIFIIDGSRNLDDEDFEIIKHMKERKVIVLLNKIDLNKKIDKEKIREFLPSCDIIETSLKNGDGIEHLEDKIEAMVFGGTVKQSDSIIVTNLRHKNLLEQALASLKDAAITTEAAQPLEFIEIDINRAYELLGEIIGETASDDIINEVFARFCLGK